MSNPARNEYNKLFDKRQKVQRVIIGLKKRIYNFNTKGADLIYNKALLRSAELLDEQLKRGLLKLDEDATQIGTINMLASTQK